MKSGNGAPSLADLVRRSIELLQVRPGGYVLVVHAGQVGRASRGNESERMLQQLVELDRAVAVARQYAGEKSLIIVAGLQETGGFAQNGYPLRSDKGVALLGINPTSNLPSFTWGTGPNGRQTPEAAAKRIPPPRLFPERGGLPTTCWHSGSLGHGGVDRRARQYCCLQSIPTRKYDANTRRSLWRPKPDRAWDLTR